MKKIFLRSLVLLALLTVFSCNHNPADETQDPAATADVTIDGKDFTSDSDWCYYKEDLTEKNVKAEVSVSAKMLVVNKSDPVTLKWQLNVTDFPTVASQEFPKGTSEWIDVSGKIEANLGGNTVIYIATYGTKPKSLTIYLKDVSVTTKVLTSSEDDKDDSIIIVPDENLRDDYSDRPVLLWTDAETPSLYKTYSNCFDHFGIAVEHGLANYSEKEFATPEIRKGIKKHTNTITMGNEFKPQFIMQLWGGSATKSGTFTASNGETIDTFDLQFSTVDAILQKCKDTGVQMRGHVLVWHSQTDEAFFREDYKSNGAFVSKEVMTARQEWYIKTVVEHVQEWEKTNNDGKHIIWVWDVVNETIGDGGSTLRTKEQGSNWYEIYKSSEFIVNAFRFANKYVSKDVLLCYNDYGCLDTTKRSGMLTVLDDVIAAKDDATLPARIDAMGMQSHISINNTATEFETAVKAFLEKGIDVQVTELDIATEASYDAAKLATAYKDLFTMLIKNRATAEKKGVTCVTIWGINDEVTWLNSADQIKWHQNKTQYPLLFEKNASGEIVTKQAFWGVYEAAVEYGK